MQINLAIGNGLWWYVPRNQPTNKENNMNMIITPTCGCYTADIYDGACPIASFHARTHAEAESMGNTFMQAWKRQHNLQQIQLKVGGIYRNRVGEQVKIIQDMCSDFPYKWTFPFISESNKGYKANGQYYSTPSDLDLIEVVSEPQDTTLEEKYDAVLNENIRLRQRLTDVANLALKAI
jgi:hypothetical protein